MSKTLFWYIFRDLLKVFLTTLGVLSGIMSFGGLLKPLMQHGLSGTQVLQILTYFMPAAQTYALPIAALFATTMVYGRLSADNEITACRATGISYLSLTVPAFILGLFLSLAALLSLCFVVPYCTLKVEKIGFSSLADIVVRSIEREHRLKLPDQTIYAESAERLPPPPDAPDDEVVVLHSPMFCSYETIEQVDPRIKRPIPIRVPSEFYTARTATVVIHQSDAGVEIFANLDGSAMFPRNLMGANLGGVEVANVGPWPLPSPIKANSKFMTIQQLKDFYKDPIRHRDILQLYSTITQTEQQIAFTAAAQKAWARDRALTFDNGEGETWSVFFQRGVRHLSTPLRLTWISQGENRDIRLVRKRNGEVIGSDDASTIYLKFQAIPASNRMSIAIQLNDVLIGTDEIRPARPSFQRVLSVPMPAEVAAMNDRGPGYYLKNTSTADTKRLRAKLSSLRSGILGEIHGRASFAISCFILVMIGSTLGMMFKTGNFLSAFALSVIPAFLCIALMITGQHVAEDDARNLHMGLGFIWSGNAVVGTLAISFLAYLRRK